MTRPSIADIREVTWLIRRAFRLMGVRVDQYLADLDISACERSVMDYLYPDHKLSVPQIAERYTVSRQFIQSTVNALHVRGIVEFLDNPKHRRSALVALTHEGKSLYRQISNRDKTAFATVFSGISEADNRTTHRTLKKIIENLSEENKNNETRTKQ